MTGPVLQKSLPNAPWSDPALWRLPGMRPLASSEWLIRDDAFDGQMALRDELIGSAQHDVHAMLPEALAAAQEALDLVLEHCASSPGYTITRTSVRRPDGIEVQISRAQPLLTIGRLIQEDICILQPGDAGEHVLTGAILCFPASWTLAEKIGRPLVRIHRPVAAYDADLARRVQRMFDMTRPGVLLCRQNALLYERPDLHQPRRESDGTRHVSGSGRYLRSERQTLLRLRRTDALVFAIHTYVVETASLTDDQRRDFDLVLARHNAGSEQAR